MKYLFTFICSLLCSGVETKRGVESRHSARNASRIRRKVGNGVLTLGTLPILLCAGYSVKLKKIYILKIPFLSYIIQNEKKVVQVVQCTEWM